jgi:hypothetical protein
MKNGKKPLSEKSTSSFGFNPDEFGNTLSIPPDLKKELDEQGLSPRWINAKKLAEMQGYHPKGWVVYKRSANMPTDPAFGNSPDGIVRRGDCVLAVKTKEAHAKHKAYLAQRVKAQAGVRTQQADELRQMAGKRIKVEEGYGEDDED